MTQMNLGGGFAEGKVEIGFEDHGRAAGIVPCKNCFTDVCLIEDMTFRIFPLEWHFPMVRTPVALGCPSQHSSVRQGLTTHNSIQIEGHVFGDGWN